MYNNNNNFYICLVIALIISITPASAVLMNSVHDDATNSTQVLSNKIKSESNQLQIQVSSLNNDLDYVQNRKNDYDWKFWKWPKITSDIFEKVYHASLTVENTRGTADQLKVDANALKIATANEDSGSYVDDINADTPDYMATELSERLKTNVKVENVQASEIEEGDIVKYVSQGKYPRYLRVVKIIEKNDTTKQKRGVADATILTFNLGGTGDFMVPLQPSLNDKFLRLNYGNAPKTTAINSSMEIHQKSIDNIRNESRSYKKDSNFYKSLSISMFSFGAAIGVLGIILAAIATGTVIGIPVGFVILGVTGLIVAALMITGGIFNELYEMNKDSANGLESYANDSQNDLNCYTKNLPKNSMNVTTFNGIPIVNQTPIPNWKDYEFLLVDQPKHGDVLPGPGIQFLYGPHEGYTGDDQFTFQYSINGKPIGLMIVNIQINPIPIVTVPQED